VTARGECLPRVTRLPSCTPEEANSSDSLSSSGTFLAADDAPSDVDAELDAPLRRPASFAWESDPIVAESLRFMRTLPPACGLAPLSGAALLLPPLPPASTSGHAPRPTLLLDLDETLVHSALAATPNADFSFAVDFNDTTHVVHVQMRPGLERFLRFAAAHFEVRVELGGRALPPRAQDSADPFHSHPGCGLHREPADLRREGARRA